MNSAPKMLFVIAFLTVLVESITLVGAQKKDREYEKRPQGPKAQIISAVEKCDVETVTTLIRNGASIESKDDEGNTLLKYSIEKKCESPSASNKSDNATSHAVQEAYDVYSAILPSEWPLRVARAKTLIIQSETEGYEMCLRPDKEWQEKIGPAISEYVALNAKPSLLEPRMNIEVPYQLIKVDELTSLIQRAGWEGFYQQYKDSGGWIELSVVGFNNDKTVAVVYMGHHCGGLCGGGGFHVLEKKAGKWVPLDWKGSSCAWAS